MSLPVYSTRSFSITAYASRRMANVLLEHTTPLFAALETHYLSVPAEDTNVWREALRCVSKPKFYFLS